MSLLIFCQNNSYELDQNATVIDLYNEIGHRLPLYFDGKRLDPYSKDPLSELGFSNEVRVEVGSLDCSLKGKQITQKMIDERKNDLSWCDLEDSNLRNLILEGADLRNGNFKNADLEGADLEDANLQGAIF